MGRTAPDWSSYGRLERLLQYLDDAEITARITGYFTPHREGQWLYHEGFEAGINNWTLDGEGTGNYQGLTVVYSKSGGVACELKTGDVIGDSATMGRWLKNPTEGHCGFEVSFSTDSEVVYIEWYAWAYESRLGYRFGVRVDTELNKLYYMDSDENWVEWLDPFYIDSPATLWNIMKLVIDLDNMRYERLLFNGTEYEITHQQTGFSGDHPWDGMFICLHVETKDSGNKTVYVDEVLVTENERG